MVVDTLYGTFDDKQLKSINDALDEIGVAMTMQIAQRNQIKAIIDQLHEELPSLPKKVVRKMAKVKFNESFETEVAENNEFEALFEGIKAVQ